MSTNTIEIPGSREAEAITTKTHPSTSPNNPRLAVLLAKVDAVLRLSNNPLGTFGELRAARAAFDEAPGGYGGQGRHLRPRLDR
jgi:hypothetical protein